MKSPIWKKKKDKLIVKQPRTSIGIAEFESEEYQEYMLKITIKEMIKYNVDQILKMNSIVNMSSKRLKTIVFLSSIALIILVISLILNYALILK